MRVKSIVYEQLTSEWLTIDVRTKREYATLPLLSYNVPIIDETLHDRLRKHMFLATFIILYGFFINRKMIDDELNKLCIMPAHVVVIGCSRGRLRSPIFAWYVALKYKCDVYVIKHGIKAINEEKVGFFTTWFKV